MPKQIIADTFETLGQTVKQMGQQAVQEPQKMTEVAGKQVSGDQSAPEEQVAGGQMVGPVQKAMNKRAASQRLTYLQNELVALRQRGTQEKQAAQAQTQQEQKTIKQLEVQKKKEEPSLAVQQAKQKAGTKERKLTGVSG